VLSNVVIGTILLVDPSEPLKSSVWHIFLVQTPGDALILEQINDRGNILRNLGKWITVETEIITFSEVSK